MRQVGLLNSGYLTRIGHNGFGYCNDSVPAFTIAPVSFLVTSPFTSASGVTTGSEVVAVTSPTYNETVICVPSGINNQHQELQTECYPNPSASGLFNVQVMGAHPKFKCYDVCGKQVGIDTQPIGENAFQLQLPNSGLYFLQVTTDSGLATIRLVVTGN